MLFAGIASGLLACADAPAPEPERSPTPTVLAPPAAAEPPPAADEILEVTIASTPSAAKVLLAGAELGTTPYVLKYRRDTTVEITADGFLPAVVTVDETSEPNVVVTLQPDPAAAAAAVTTEGRPEAKTSSTPASGKPSAAPASTASPATPPPSPASAKPTSTLPYPDVAAAKGDYQKGKIDRDAYDQAVRKLKVRRNEKIAAIRAEYQAGKIDKDEYARRKRIIDNEYRGS